jgi:hypothetical protein
MSGETSFLDKAYRLAGLEPAPRPKHAPTLRAVQVGEGLAPEHLSPTRIIATLATFQGKYWVETVNAMGNGRCFAASAANIHYGSIAQMLRALKHYGGGTLVFDQNYHEHKNL